jgi:hypothetical protein
MEDRLLPSGHRQCAEDTRGERRQQATPDYPFSPYSQARHFTSSRTTSPPCEPVDGDGRQNLSGRSRIDDQWIEVQGAVSAQVFRDGYSRKLTFPVVSS